MTQTTWAPSKVIKLPVRTRAPRPVEDPRSVPSDRWWRVGWQEDGDGGTTIGLVGCRASVVWGGSVAMVPCTLTDGQTGMCPCGLHAPADAIESARALGSIVVGGRVRMLDTAIAPGGADVVVASIEGPLSVVAWCGGAQDGFTVERCERTPRWVVRGCDAAEALCTRHLLRRSGPIRFDAVPLRRFMQRVGDALGRFGVEVRIGIEDTSRPVAPNPSR